ncbi:CPBP family intramembrane glutamic endopeptidase [Solihabitans fulvus]|uniref:CPBP family intramembrane glutamic endopeptidase n=1 Tax=Solihabitans fulvus TaxID=1892852 RepID=UPI001CB75DF9|nr:CPBP family intramembrane glutamic endopeptidase [Solihabitans fulvus]
MDSCSNGLLLRIRSWRTTSGSTTVPPLATGLIWAAWHYPPAFLGYVQFPHLLVGLAVWTVSFQLQEIILAWLRLHSGSIWPASLAHVGNNMVVPLGVVSGVILLRRQFAVRAPTPSRARRGAPATAG